MVPQSAAVARSARPTVAAAIAAAARSLASPVWGTDLPVVLVFTVADGVGLLGCVGGVAGGVAGGV